MRAVERSAAMASANLVDRQGHRTARACGRRAADGRRGRVLSTALAAVLAASAAAFPQSAVPLPVTGELQVNQAVAGNQEAPAAGMREDGVHVVVWQSAGQDASGSAIVVRHFPADGSQPANESVLNELTAGDQFAPAVSMNASGDWFAVWDTATAAQGLRGRATTGGGTSGWSVAVP